MGKPKTRMACLRVEVMEERIALSSLGHAAPVLQPALVHRTTVHRSPFIRLLTPQLTGTNITSALVNPRSGIVQIKGSITLPPNFSGGGYFPFTVTLTQPLGRYRSVAGSGIAVAGVPSSLQTPSSFTLNLTASNGKFGRGWATLTLPDYSTGYNLTATWQVYLRR
jgi:hypothetical protein